MYLLTVFLFSWLVKSSMTTEYALATTEIENGEVARVDIALDNTTMLTYPGEPYPPPACFQKTVNFHDFEKQLVAMKIVGKGRCLIKSSNETYEQVKQVVDGIHQGKTKPIKQVIEKWRVPRHPLSSEEVESTVGKKIAKFCTGYTVYMLYEGKDTISSKDFSRISKWKEQKERKARRACKFLCFSCSLVAVQ